LLLFFFCSPPSPLLLLWEKGCTKELIKDKEVENKLEKQRTGKRGGEVKRKTRNKIAGGWWKGDTG
jgi:hypothetical protein